MRRTWQYDSRKRQARRTQARGQGAKNKRGAVAALQTAEQRGVSLDRIPNHAYLIPDETASLLPPNLCSAAESKISIDLSAVEILFFFKAF